MRNEDDTWLSLGEPFDGAIVGFATPWPHRKKVAVYNAREVLEILTKDGMSYEDALEYFDFNIECAYHGEQTPIFLWPPDDEEG